VRALPAYRINRHLVRFVAARWLKIRVLDGSLHVLRANASTQVWFCSVVSGVLRRKLCLAIAPQGVAPHTMQERAHRNPREDRATNV
jgi:hypothetical protein